jgi:peroxiredoxin
MIHRPGAGGSAVLLVLGAGVLLMGVASPALSFANVDVGGQVPDVRMQALDGGEQPLLGKKKANVFLFFRPDQEHCVETLKNVSKLERELSGKPVYWVAVVSDSYPPQSVKACVKDTELPFPVLVDKGDALYGQLGVRLLPVMGIADEKGILVAYLHFTKVNFAETIRAHVLHQLGEISDAQLAAVENPSRTGIAGDGSAAAPQVKLARALFKGGKLPKALEAAGKAVEADPKLAEAHALLGQILAAMGDCAKALPAFEKALEIDPAQPEALEGKKGCKP